MVIGIIGCFLPALPGPPIGYGGLLLLQLSSQHPFTVRFLVMFGLLTAAAAVLDYLIPVYGAKKFQGSGYGVWGSVIGLILGTFFFPPFGIVIGPVVGAFAGELVRGRNTGHALKAALGSFVGFLVGTGIKLILTVTMAYHFIVRII